MEDQPARSGPRRFLKDPLHVYRPASLAGLALAVGSGLSLAWLEGGAQALALGMCWLGLLPLALLHGWGRALFIEHGVGIRRALGECVAGWLLALSACAALSLDGAGMGGTLVTLLLGLALYLAVFRALSAGAGLLLGRGVGYMSRRLQGMEDDSW